MRIAILVAAIVCLTSCKKKCPPLPAETLVDTDVPADVARVIVELGQKNKVCGINAHYPELAIDSRETAASFVGEDLDAKFKAIGWNRVSGSFNGTSVIAAYGTAAGTIEFSASDKSCAFAKVCVSKPIFWPPGTRR